MYDHESVDHLILSMSWSEEKELEITLRLSVDVVSMITGKKSAIPTSILVWGYI